MARMTDGHPTFLLFDLNPNTYLWTMHVKPPGLSGGGKNDITTMENQLVRTFFPKTLFTATEARMQVQYDPRLYNDVLDMIIQNQQCTVFFPDTSSLLFYGWLEEFEPNDHKEGEPPNASMKIECSNVDASLNETVPVYVP